MTSELLPTVAAYIRSLASRNGPGRHGLIDAELLDRFVASRDEAAFEVLVWRHGAMVLGVCRRLLPGADAEDAFQATFLALVRKASTISRKEALAGWLYRVAYRAALAARKRAGRHQPLSVEAIDSLAAKPEDDGWGDLKPVLDREVDRLPGGPRSAFVLCCLEGKTVDEAAAELGRPRGTVGSWVSRAREKLRDLLARRGLAPPAAALAAALAHTANAAPPAAALVRATAHAAALSAAGKVLPAGLIAPHVPALATGALHALFVTQVKSVMAVVALGLGMAALAIGTAAGVVARQPAAGREAAVVAVARPAPAPGKPTVDQPAAPAPAARPEPGPKADKAPEPKADKVPEEAHGFRGVVVGQFIGEGPGAGSLVLAVKEVQQVHPESEALKPKSVRGMTLRVNGVAGKFAAVLATLVAGDGVVIEARHVAGDDLTFAGGGLKKVELPTPGKGKKK